MCVTVGVIPFVVIVGGIAVFRYPGAADIIQSTGVAIGAVCTGAGFVIGAVGAFRLGDTKHAPPLQTTTTTTTATTGTAPGATTADPLHVAVDDMPTKKAVKKRGRR